MYEVVFTYKVDGGWYGGTFNTRTPYAEGDILVVEYDPKDPESNKYVEREKRLRWVYIAFFAVLGLLAIWLLLQPNAG